MNKLEEAEDLGLKRNRALPPKLSGLNVACRPDPDLGLVGDVVIAVYRENVSQELRDSAAAILREQFPGHPVSVVVA